MAETRERLRHRGADPEPPSLKYAIPILQATADEENEELQDLWSRLLAAAMDPNRRDAMRQSFIQVVKQMDPLDAVVLKAVRENGDLPLEPSRRDWIASKLNCSADEVIVSFNHLARLDCTTEYVLGARMKIEPSMKPLGTLLMNVVSD